MSTTPDLNDPIKLRDFLDQRFSMKELKKLCFSLDIDHEDLDDASTRSLLIQSLVSHCERHGKMPELIAACRKLRPGFLTHPKPVPPDEPVVIDKNQTRKRASTEEVRIGPIVVRNLVIYVSILLMAALVIGILVRPLILAMIVTPTPTVAITHIPTPTPRPNSTPALTPASGSKLLAPGEAVFLTFTSGSGQEKGTQIIFLASLEPGWYSFSFESADIPNTGHFLVWDYIALLKNRSPIWEIGQNETPPDFSERAFSEFCDPQRETGCESEFVINLSQAKNFAKDLNDGNYPLAVVMFELTEEEAGNELSLLLSTLYSSHPEVDSFSMKVSLREGDQP